MSKDIFSQLSELVLFSRQDNRFSVISEEIEQDFHYNIVEFDNTAEETSITVKQRNAHTLQYINSLHQIHPET